MLGTVCKSLATVPADSFFCALLPSIYMACKWHQVTCSDGQDFKQHFMIKHVVVCVCSIVIFNMAHSLFGKKIDAIRT